MCNSHFKLLIVGRFNFFKYKIFTMYFLRPEIQGILGFCRQIKKVEKRHMYSLVYCLVTQQLNSLLVVQLSRKKQEGQHSFFYFPQPTLIDLSKKVAHPLDSLTKTNLVYWEVVHGKWRDKCEREFYSKDFRMSYI